MKSFLNAVWEILTEIGRIRAAATAARAGNFTAAIHLIK